MYRYFAITVALLLLSAAVIHAQESEAKSKEFPKASFGLKGGINLSAGTQCLQIIQGHWNTTDKNIRNTKGKSKSNGGYSTPAIKVFWKLREILAWNSG